MTALTPQQMRELAKNLDGVTPNPAVWVYEADWAHQAAGALRTAADQLEAVRRLVKRSGRHLGMNGEYYTVPMRDLDAILTADTAPLEYPLA